MSSSRAEHGFSYPREQFQQIVEDCLALAREAGASDASVEVSEGSGLSVSVRKGELENVERNRDKSVGVSVYLGQRRGNASSSDFSAAALRQASPSAQRASHGARWGSSMLRTLRADCKAAPMAAASVGLAQPS